MRVVRTRTRGVENDVKKKIRAIQYGVGPIGASIARLMREKQAIEICGAIDTDRAKVGGDLGEVVEASNGPWGGKISADAKEELGQAPDDLIAWAASVIPTGIEQC